MPRMVATASFLHRPSGRMVRKGQTVDADDPIVAAVPGVWRADVEHTTAAPGDRRNTKRPPRAKR